MRLLLFLFCLFLWGNVKSQILPSQRSANWNQAGCMEDYPTLPTQLNLLDFGGIPDGISDNSEALHNAIVALEHTPGIINIPEGHFHFTKAIYLTSNVVLKGASASSTLLSFELEEENHLINSIGSISTESTSLLSDGLKGDSKITLSSTENLLPGDHIYLLEEDQDLVHNDWAVHSTGQICRISGIQGQEVFLEQELRRSFQLGQQARIKKINPITQVGIENLSLERLDATQSQTSNIYFEYAADCWVNCIESNHCNFAHVELNKSTNVEVRGSYFHDAFNYGGGGKAYGVMLHLGTGECLIENNIFNHLRHAMILQAGANGNVLAYNYSQNPFWTGVQLPSNAAGDLVLHGNYPYCNLLEGNIIQNIVIDNSHGINGPYNTFFRNRAELYGIFMNNNPVSNSQNFIGNEISNSGFLMGLYFIAGEDHFEMANNDLGIILPNSITNLDAASLYLEAQPDFFSESYTWPSIGIPNELEANMIPAKDRYIAGDYTVCEVEETITNTIEVESTQIRVFPNPVSHLLEIESAESIEMVKVYRLDGRLVLAESNLNQIHVERFEKGLYSLIIQLANRETVVKKIIKH